jgi:hypothetical protein
MTTDLHIDLETLMQLPDAFYIATTEEEPQGRCWDNESVLWDAVFPGGFADAAAATETQWISMYHGDGTAYPAR